MCSEDAPPDPRRKTARILQAHSDGATVRGIAKREEVNPGTVAKVLATARYQACHQGKEGFVYFIAPVGGGNIKIGWAKWPSRRLAEFQVGSPVLLEVIGILQAPPTEERKLHRRFATARLHGEWFAPCLQLLEFIQQTKITSASNP